MLLCGNLFGDIVADLCAGLVGWPEQRAVDQPDRGERARVAGASRCSPRATEIDQEFVCTEDSNPLPILLPALHLLRHLDMEGEAERLHDATAATLESGVRPKALGGEATREAFCAAVESRL